MANNAKPSQKFIAAETVNDNVVIMKDGSLKAILLTSSVNFELKSTEEQNALLFQYQNFLNSLDFSTQIIVQSRKLDLDEYIATVSEQSRLETNELLKIQAQEYIDFVRGFVEISNVMAKTFYIAVSVSPLEGMKKGGISGLFSSSKKIGQVNAQEFLRLKNQLDQRVDYIISGIRAMGVRAVRLGKDELLELLYSLYNPGEEKSEEMLQQAKI